MKSRTKKILGVTAGLGALAGGAALAKYAIPRMLIARNVGRTARRAGLALEAHGNLLRKGLIGEGATAIDRKAVAGAQRRNLRRMMKNIRFNRGRIRKLSTRLSPGSRSGSRSFDALKALEARQSAAFR